MIGAQQITSRHDRNSNKSQLVSSRYSFLVCRKLRRNCFVCSKSQKEAEFAFGTLNSTKSRPQPFCAEQYFTMKTLTATPRPYDRWKAETLSFLHLLLVLGVKLTSLLATVHQNYGIILKGTYFRKIANSPIKR